MRSILVLFAFHSLCGAARSVRNQRIRLPKLKKRFDLVQLANMAQRSIIRVSGVRHILGLNRTGTTYSLRDGVSYGEFRDEVLLDGRFASMTEQYLVADARETSILLKLKVRKCGWALHHGFTSIQVVA